MAQNNAFRQVLLFTPNSEDSIYLKQIQSLNADKAGCDERDIKIETFIFSKTDKNILKKYAITTPQFAFVLVGKDRGIRLRSNKMVSKDKLFALIDSMPMRQDEMKRLKKQ